MKSSTIASRNTGRLIAIGEPASSVNGCRPRRAFWPRSSNIFSPLEIGTDMVHSEGPPEDAGPELITPKIIFYVLNGISDLRAARRDVIFYVRCGRVRRVSQLEGEVVLTARQYRPVAHESERLHYRPKPE